MIKDGVIFYATTKDIPPKEAMYELEEYLGVYISNYLREKKNLNQEKANNIATNLCKKFVEKENLYEATDEVIEKFIDNELEQDKTQ